MRFSRLFSSSLVVGVAACATIIACGGSSRPGGGGGGGGPDAKTFEDAKTYMDAAASTLTLGKKCGSAGDCPASAPQCIGIAIGSGSSPTYCTPVCDTNGSGMTNGSGQFTSITPAPNNGTCTAAYTGAGSASCSLLLAWTPMDTPLKASTTYTAISMGCLIACGSGNTCAAGMTCNTSVMFCFPT